MKQTGEPRDYLSAMQIIDENGNPTERWLLAKAYVRLSRSGEIKLPRFSPNRCKSDRHYKNRTNHENHRWLINELAQAGLLRVHYRPDVIELKPAKRDWLEVMNIMDAGAKPPIPAAYSDNALMGTL